MNQAEFARIFCERPESYAWFLGAGASHNANLPTAEDIITDLKRRFYCSEENQNFSTKDLQNEAVRAQIEAYMRSRGFPERWSAEEYTTYFETIFGEDRERQRRYISSILADDRVRLAVGNRVFGALLASGLCRMAFTTNFDPVVEKAVAEIFGKPLSAYHLEGAHNAVSALNNEQFPIYCKLHGDFQYDSIKNLSSDLATQNAQLSQCMTMAGARFGFLVAGYSGRDESIMALFKAMLEAPNPFPHGLYWLKIRDSTPIESVTSLMEEAKAAGVRAEFVDIETYDTVMLRLWRNLPNQPDGFDAKVRKGRAGTVQISVPEPQGGRPVLRLNSLPMTRVPTTCARVKLKTASSWEGIADLKRKPETSAVLTFDGNVLAWGGPEDIENSFGADFFEKSETTFDPDWRTGSRLHIKNFLEEGLAHQCAGCRKQTSVTAGTVLHRTHLPLKVWFLAAWLVATHRNGISARQLWLQLGLGSYKTAWLLLQKLRRAMIAPDRSPLSGLVEVDETSMPFRTKSDPITPKPGRSHEGKMMIAGAVEIHDKAPGRLRLKVIEDYSAKTLSTFVQ